MKQITYDDIEMPEYALSYLVNDDPSGLDDCDIEAIDAYMDQFYEEAVKVKGNVVIGSIPEESSFTHWPAFGLPCNCYTISIYILY